MKSSIKPTLGTCYYPEHWPAEQWSADAAKMVELGLTWVRIGEFAWSRLEPQADVFEWAWLDQAIEVLGQAGLKVILGTPTATPPRWMLDKHPDMLAVDINGNPRKFGSRRHYCFSHQAYRQESVRIAQLLAQRYGANPYIHAWQIDNEYGCHDTVVSYSDAARAAFCCWLASKYSDVDSLNKAWGNVFWSMEYTRFEDVDLPNLTVTEANPSHVLDFKRFSSDQVVVYNRAQVDVIRPHTQAPLIHNYMGRIIEFDHYKVGNDLDIASWDSYPLGFLVDRSGADADWQLRFHRQGDPDFQAFHHDLYRAVGKGRWWVMEQQPGPVNWAPNNPAPLPGMVRLWTWEAIAHQAEAVCYFRWRQAPFAQEQMHAGLLRPDSEPSATYPEIEQVAQELASFGELEPKQAEVALVFDYESCWAWETQPQGENFDYFSLALDYYKALRRLGLSIDILPPDSQQLSDYKLVLAPGLMAWPKGLLEQVEQHKGAVMLGPRAGSRTENFAIPEQMPPAVRHLDCKVAYVETLAKGAERSLTKGGKVHTWFEKLETSESVLEQLEDGSPVLIHSGTSYYLGASLDAFALKRVFTNLCETVGLKIVDLPEGLRMRSTASHQFIFNHNAEATAFEGHNIAPAGVHISKVDNA